MRERHPLVTTHPHPRPGPGIKPSSQVCTLDWESNPRPLGAQTDTLTTDQQQTGVVGIFLIHSHQGTIAVLVVITFFLDSLRQWLANRGSLAP